ncbi:uncharacterized protein LOC111715189 [Eurytemora carolleeae]|uniref:uncharacterized protein LOC111715189 n=1 Tax=Eurytemora carolleeae TaxID=1294199 RepID=UPI000C765A51|nr:uncharacterized protein LOC111715189 [Eurytemora carolleeae]|eukprot:XP_023346236.1 uncharacterized protein LOC111715189 [Eurytemora affinis]
MNILNITVVPLILLFLNSVHANLRCYSCFPCTEFDYFTNVDPRRFEQDCYLDRHCYMMRGTVRDAYGYSSQVSIRGCPWGLSILAGNLQDGCTNTEIQVAGLGLVKGDLCLCDGHLCNSSPRTRNISKLVWLLSFSFFIFKIL